MALTKVSGPLLHGSNDNLGNYVINNITGAAATFTGNVSIGGTLTYDDVTNVESVGIVTARGGLHVGVGGTIINAMPEDNGSLGIGQSIFHIGDTDTNFGFDSDNQIVFNAGGNEKLKVDSSGNVYFAGNRSGNDRGIIYNDSNGFGIYGSSSGTNHRNIIFFSSSSGSSEKVRITSGGSVGIGTDNPGKHLEVYRNGLVNARIKGNVASGLGAELILQNANAAANGYSEIQFQDSGTNVFSKIRGFNLTDGSNNGYMALYTASATEGLKERVRISDAGKVGIGSTVPTAKLEVRGSGSNTTLNFLTKDVNRNNVFWAQDGGRVGVHYSPFVINQDTTDTATPSGTFFYVHHASSPFAIKNDGKVGIGSHTPSYTLDVNGDNGGGFTATTNSTHGQLSVVGKNSAGNVSAISRIKSYPSGSGNTSQMAFETRNSSSSMVERLRITSTGNIGINSTSPNAQFVLNRSLTENNGIEMGYSSSGSGLHFIQAYNRSTSAFTKLVLNNSIGISTGGKVEFTADVNPVAEFNRGSASNTNINLKYNGTFTGQVSAANADFQLSAVGASTPMSFYTNGGARLTIDSGGDIFIGTTTDIAPTNGTNLCVSDATISRLILEKQSTIKFGLNVSDSFTIYDETNDAARFTIDSNGKVGMNLSGTDNTSPVRNLDIADPSGAILRLISSDDSLGANERIGAIEFYTDDDDGGHVSCAITAFADPSDSFGRRGALSFSTQSSDSPPADAIERLRIQAGGTLITGGHAEAALAVHTGTSRGVNITQNGRIYCKTDEHWDLNHVGAGLLIRFRAGNDAGNTQLVVGNITLESNAVQFNTTQSDSRLKKNIEPWTDEVLPNFKTLQPKKFHFNWQSDTDSLETGYVAQDLVSAFPEAYPLCKTDIGESEEVDRHFFNPSGMVKYLMKALQEEIVKREEIEAKYNALEARISALEGS